MTLKNRGNFFYPWFCCWGIRYVSLSLRQITGGRFHDLISIIPQHLQEVFAGSSIYSFYRAAAW